jgi:CRISPR-associated exonuclease Cas4
LSNNQIFKAYSEDDLLPLSGIQHFAYCPRQWALIHVESQWVENASTAQGRIVHRRVDDPYFQETRGLVKTERAIPLISWQLGLHGIADLLEIHKQEGVQVVTYSLVEYKRGKPKPDDRDEVQLCAQAICLEEMRNTVIDSGCIYYDAVKGRETVIFTADLRQRVADLAGLMHKCYAEGLTPAAVKSRKCINCSMVNICLPKLGKLKGKETAYIQNFVQELETEL